MIYGIMQPDAGEILLERRSASRIANPKAARKLGIGMVFQHFSLFEALTVLENIALGHGREDPGARARKPSIGEVMRTYGLQLDPHRTVPTLSVGERQRIEIVRALLLNPKLLIMDEPTSVLTPQEVEQLFVVLRQLAPRKAARSSTFRTSCTRSKRSCDTATILRGGKLVDTCDPKLETTRAHGREDDRRGAQGHRASRRAGRLASRAAEGERVRRLPEAGPPRHGPRRRHLHRAGRRDPRHRGRRGQRTERAAAGAVGRGATGDARGDHASMAARCGDSTPSNAGSGACAVPEERNGHAAVPEFTLATTLS